MPNSKPKPIIPKHKLSASQQAAIDFMNNTADISDRDFMNLIGVLVRIKPATMLYPSSDAVLAKYRQLAQDLGLFYQELSKKYDKFPLLLVATKKSDLQKLVISMNQFFSRTKDEFIPELERTIGRLVGFPESAIDYYIERLATYHQTGELSDFVELPAEYQDFEPFLEFILSPANYQAEIACYLEPLRQAVKQYAPALYQRIATAEQ